ncbi:efflux RND transporter permease subunit [Pseudoalteromonas rubra]|nr:efflux RND transporter permease subunit [Pseudoalteromonas rubra]
MRNNNNHSKLYICLTVALVIIGSMLIFKLPVSLYPSVNKPSIQLTFYYHQEVQSFYRNWGVKIEDSLKAIEGVDEVEGKYQQGSTKFIVSFDWNISPEQAKRDVAAIGASYQAQLPKNLPPLKLGFYDPGSENYVAIKSDIYGAGELSELLARTLEPQLKEIESVSRTLISQKYEKVVSVKLDPYAMLEHNVDLDDIMNTLHRNEFDKRIGTLETRHEGDMSIHFRSGVTNLERLRNLRVHAKPGVTLRLADLADVSINQKENARFFQYNEDDVVVIAIWPDPDANQYKVATEFQRLVAKETHSLGHVFVLNDPKKFIDDAIVNILIALLVGMLSAAIVVLMVYRKFSTVMLISISMPIALATSIISMSVAGVGINILSLGAMSISIGMVVDGAVVVLDSIQVKCQNRTVTHRLVFGAVRDVRSSLITSTLTSVFVFFPLAFTSPMTAAILNDLALVIVAVLISSFFISAYFLPSLYLLVFGGKVIHAKSAAQPKNIEKASGFDSLVRWLFSNNWKRVSIIAAVALYVGFVLVELPPKLKAEIIAQPKAEIIDVGVSFAKQGLGSDEKVKILAPIRQKIQDDFKDSVKYVYSDIRANSAYLSVHLKSYKDFDQVFSALPKSLADVKEETSYSPWITSALKIKDHPSFSILFTHENEEVNRQLLASAYQFIKTDERVYKSKAAPKASKISNQELIVREDFLNQLLVEHDYSQSVDSLTRFVNYTASPQEVFQVKTDEGYFPLELKISNHKYSTQDIEQTPLHFAGHNLFLQDLIKFEEVASWREFYSRNSKPLFRLQVWMAVNDQQINADLMADLKAHLLKAYSEESLPIVVKDMQQEVRQGVASIKNALFLSVAIVFLVALYQFRTLTNALIICSVIVLGLSGAFHALYIFNSTLSLNSMLGMLILVGLTVNNSILLLDFFLREKLAGKTVMDALCEALKRRMRSLIVTNLTTVVAMVPLAIGFGAGQDILKPLGISVVLGLAIATLLTLLVVPALISLKSWDKQEELTVDLPSSKPA